MLTDGKLKEIRLNKGFKQQYVSIYTGIHQSRIYRFERGELSPTLDETDKILTCLGFTGVLSLEASK